jgi:hypothetical protein
MLPEKPEPILLRQILRQAANVGHIYASQPSFSVRNWQSYCFKTAPSTALLL